MIPREDRSKEGSFFCLKCGREYGKAGICCGEKTEFIRESDSRYLKLVMGSKMKKSQKPKISYTRPFAKNPNSKEEIRWL